ncbi:MAG: bifunctional diaminohydroxyphosphoribosylaminopyrimidine deaminase/5-amino-6-(5-phosphoribosylamino)uracil reductase RibD [Bacteroidota bacterium]
MDTAQEHFMERALSLARLGLGNVSPNPLVGCVIVHKGKIIGEGYHKKYGEAHAEVNAVASVQNKALLQESTAYVSLEPCAHHGKTPPCADMLIDNKIKKVVIAIVDPFSKVNGLGVKKLKDAGVEVEMSALENKALELNKRFFTFHEKKRPYIILKWAQTHDGFIAREDFDSKWISNPYSRQLVHQWRAEEDAILIGKNTAIYDTPSLTVRDWKGKNPTRVLLDANLDVPNLSPLFNDEVDTLIFNKKKEGHENKNEWIQVDTLSPAVILEILHKKNIQSLIVEGGTQVLNSFITENCWDEARIFTSPQSFGKGVNAPPILGEIVKSETIFEDELKTIKNNG